MRKIVECVPNFSEGKNRETIEAIAAAIRKFVASSDRRSPAEGTAAG